MGGLTKTSMQQGGKQQNAFQQQKLQQQKQALQQKSQQQKFQKNQGGMGFQAGGMGSQAGGMGFQAGGMGSTRERRFSGAGQSPNRTRSTTYQSGMGQSPNRTRSTTQRSSGGGSGTTQRRRTQQSDILLKHDVVKIGIVADGIGLYRFQYNWSDQVYVGVVAQEVAAVRPDAVIRGSDGYLRVDYDRIGAPFDTWQHWQATGGQGSGR